MILLFDKYATNPLPFSYTRLAGKTLIIISLGLNQIYRHTYPYRKQLSIGWIKENFDQIE
jgi:hypothetical protein